MCTWLRYWICSTNDQPPLSLENFILVLRGLWKLKQWISKNPNRKQKVLCFKQCHRKLSFNNLSQLWIQRTDIDMNALPLSSFKNASLDCCKMRRKCLWISAALWLLSRQIWGLDPCLTRGTGRDLSEYHTYTSQMHLWLGQGRGRGRRKWRIYWNHLFWIKPQSDRLVC